MINILVIAIGGIFILVAFLFAAWSANNTRKIDVREKYYNEFMKRKSEREKLRISR
ncbi:hypothetical protein SAMN05216596_102207 [Pseudomonas congelans]|uniref:Uncharacterized protein n=1 Tax=Pseudomonas congelans TaxID=200452 RepID=A0A1H0NDC0_9PSED|nr:hypothetical protein SAMN05216596_102207 [Pseudomonas congelans]